MDNNKKKQSNDKEVATTQEEGSTDVQPKSQEQNSEGFSNKKKPFLEEITSISTNLKTESIKEFENIFFIDRIRKDLEVEYLPYIYELLEKANSKIYKLKQSFFATEGNIGQIQTNGESLRNEISALFSPPQANPINNIYIYLPNIVYLLKAFDHSNNSGEMEVILQGILNDKKNQVKFFTIGTEVEYSLAEDNSPYFLETFNKITPFEKIESEEIEKLFNNSEINQEEIKKIHNSTNRISSSYISTYLNIKDFLEKNKKVEKPLTHKEYLINKYKFNPTFLNNLDKDSKDNDFLTFAQNEENKYKGHEDKLRKLNNKLLFFNKTLTSSKKPKKPPLITLLIGSTGTGKTEITKIVSKYIYKDESEKKYLRFNMGEYRTKEKLEIFVKDLKRALAVDPFRVVVLDEFEKGSDEIKYLLYKIFDSDLDIDHKGNIVDYTSTIFFLTSNLGVDTKIEGFASYNEIVEKVKKEYELSFISRLDMIIYLDNFSSDFIDELIEKFHDEFFETYKIEETSKNKISFYDKEVIKDNKKEIVQTIKNKSDLINGGARDVRRKVFDVLENAYIKLT